MKTKYIIFLIFALIMVSNISIYAQETKLDIASMTKEDVLKLSYDDLLNLPFEDLLKLADIAGVSAVELLDMILNMEVSTASKKTESVFDSPLSTTVITKEEIYKSGVNSIPEALRLAPGIIVREKTNGNYDVHIRGNDNVPPGNFSHFAENSMTLVMIDNRIVYNYINGGTFWESLPIGLSDIERIDVIRGASSALYGPNAVSGVINIITKVPEDGSFSADADVRYGTFNTIIAETGVSGGLGEKFRYRVSGNLEQRNRYQADYYCFAKGRYVEKDSVVSVFSKPYATDERNTLPTPDMATDRYGINTFLFYDVNDDVHFNLRAGLQNSISQTIFFENLATPFANRYSKTSYVDFSTQAYGFSGQVSYQAGVQDLSVGLHNLVIRYDMSAINANLEYTYNYKDILSIRPGFNYQLATYDDSEHVKSARADRGDNTLEGLLNGKNSLTLIGGGIRTDFAPTDKLRIIAALRLDKYEKPDDIYFSYQFVASYKPNDKHLFRAVYSRANRSAFIGNVNADFQNHLGSRPGGIQTISHPITGDPLDVIVEIDNYYQYYLGNENLKLLTQDMIEVGHRFKISDNLQTDIELFYTKTKDFDVLAQTGNPKVINGLDFFTPIMPTLYIDYHDSLEYNNIIVESQQLGGSFSINYMPFKKLLLKAYGTYQKTDLKSFVPDETDPTTKVDIEHEWTPSFYGGLTINYMPIKKLGIYANLYYLGSQVYKRYESPYGENGTDRLGDKGILSLKVSYNFNDNISAYLSARNLTNNKATEFGFADEIGSLYMIGVKAGF